MNAGRHDSQRKTRLRAGGGRWAKALLVAALAAAVLAGAESRRSDIYKQVERFVEVLSYIRQYYVEETDDEELLNAAIDRMLADLDPHSHFLEAEQYQNLRIGTTGTYSGVGMEVSTRMGYLVVISPMEGGPASRAGIKTGDLITAIDGKDAFGMLLHEAVKILRGPKGTKVRLTVRREGEPEPLEFELERDVVTVPSVPLCSPIEGDIGYVRLARFSARTSQELESCLEELIDGGARGLVLDLRGNPGGLLTEAVRVCELFVPKDKVIVSTRGRRESENVEYISRAEGERFEIPLVVLVNEGTASAAEIVAGAIQDWDLGVIMGEQTFGKGSVQRVMSLGEQEGLKLTTSYYYTPSGRCIHKSRRSQESGDQSGAGGERSAKYLTAGGRVVLGGGGIAPDLVIRPDEAPALVKRIEGRGLFFGFAVKYTGEHPELGGPEVTPSVLDAFKEYLLDEGLTFETEEFDDAFAWIARGLRRELARKLQGDRQAGLIAMEGDGQLRAAVELLKGVSTRKELLEAASRYAEELR